MTDKEFDKLLKDSLTSDEVPSALNGALLEKARKKKNGKAKIYKFVKTGSACAAVFVCAVAILSYYNSGMQLPEESITPSVKTHTATEKEVIAGEAETNGEISPQAAASEKSVPAAPKKAQALPKEPEKASLPEKAEAVADISADTASAESAEDVQIEESLPTVFSRAKAATDTLSELFNEDFDYTAVINERISLQIAELPNSADYTFEGISGNEAFTLNEENLLTITFAAGEIAAKEHGEQFFTVGTAVNGILE